MPSQCPDVNTEETSTSYLQQHFTAVNAHGIHGAEGHEGDGDRGRRVHCVVVTERTKSTGSERRYKKKRQVTHENSETEIYSARRESTVLNVTS